MTNAKPKSLLKLLPNVLYVIWMAVFFIISALLYEPQGLCDILHTGEGNLSLANVYYFNITIVLCVILVSLLISRSTLLLMKRKFDVSQSWYVTFCLVELTFASASVALYLRLVSGTSYSYFVYLIRCLSIILPIMAIPSLIHYLSFQLRDSRNAEDYDEGKRLKFYDNRHLLKFITYSSSVLFIESNENYIIIHYLDAGTEKKYQLRNTMKSVELISEKAGFVRVHRGYIVNPSHVKSVRKDEGGLYFADLGENISMEVPVSKRYYNNITALL